MRNAANLVLLWGAATTALNALALCVDAAYDSGGLKGLLWWSGQALVLPASLVSEGLNSIGIDSNGYAGHMIIVVVICACALLALSLMRRGEDAA